jgi:hypothetical protein
MTGTRSDWLDHLVFEHDRPPFRTGFAIGLRRITAEQFHWLKHPGCTWSPEPEAQLLWRAGES